MLGPLPSKKTVSDFLCFWKSDKESVLYHFLLYLFILKIDFKVFLKTPIPPLMSKKDKAIESLKSLNKIVI